MGCFCKTSLNALLANLKKMPLAALASAFPTPISLSHMAAISAALNASVAGSAVLSPPTAMLKLAASARLSASLNVSAVARLEAIAAIQQQMGINLLAPNASARLSLAIHSANLHLPSFSAALNELLKPILAALAEISAAVAAMMSIKARVGINLVASANANLQASLSAFLAANPAMSASLNANATASAKATANLQLHMRLAAAAKLLGVNILTPSGIAQLSASLQAAANLKVPVINPAVGAMGMLAAAIGQLAAIAGGLGLNLLSPTAGPVLASAKATLSASIKAMAALTIPKTLPSAVLSATASATATATASANASLSAVAAADFSKLNLPSVPVFPKLTMLANLNAQLSFNTPIMQNTPCSGCSFGRG